MKKIEFCLFFFFGSLLWQLKNCLDLNTSLTSLLQLPLQKKAFSIFFFFFFNSNLGFGKYAGAKPEVLLS